MITLFKTSMAATLPVMVADAPILRTRELVKVYQTPAGKFEALKNVNIEIQSGEFIVIIGKSGAGKSTLVNMITGVDHLTSGEIWVGDTPIHTLNEDQMAWWRGRTVGVVYQSFQLMPTLSLLDNILLPMDFCGLYRPDESEARALDLLRMVELENQAYKIPSTISGGQQQRAAIARALANDPPLIVADEPTGNLDSVTSETILAVFEALVEQGKTLLVVTHDHAIAQHATRVLHIADGQIVDDSEI